MQSTNDGHMGVCTFVRKKMVIVEKTSVIAQLTRKVHMLIGYGYDIWENTGSFEC